MPWPTPRKETTVPEDPPQASLRPRRRPRSHDGVRARGAGWAAREDVARVGRSGLAPGTTLRVSHAASDHSGLTLPCLRVARACKQAGKQASHVTTEAVITPFPLPPPPSSSSSLHCKRPPASAPPPSFASPSQRDRPKRGRGREGEREKEREVEVGEREE